MKIGITEGPARWLVAADIVSAALVVARDRDEMRARKDGFEFDFTDLAV
jgi:hypothetical protein